FFISHYDYLPLLKLYAKKIPALHDTRRGLQNAKLLRLKSYSALAAAASTLAETIESGLRGGSPLLMASTTSIPSTTLPYTVYWPFKKPASPKVMKNWLLAESGSLVRAIPTVPRT